MRVFPSMISKRAQREYKIQLGRELLYAYGGDRMIEAVTSSPRALEGGRPSLVIKNETHHWLQNNEGWEMADVIDRNAAKSADGAARALSITNAYDPSEESVAQNEREAYEAMESGRSLATGMLYDSLEAPANSPLDPVELPKVLAVVRGDSYWLNTERIVNTVLDPRNSPSRSRRFWLNQIVSPEDAWVDDKDWDLCAAHDGVPPLAPKDEIALFGDMSKSDDATALVACRLHDGLVVTIDMWQRPPQQRAGEWTAPRPLVDQAVERVFQSYNVAAFWADPSHTFDDESGERYWDGLIDEWHRKYGAQLELWAEGGERRGHSIMWDMASPARLSAFTAAAERTATDITEHIVLHDGDRRLRTHVRNARRYPTRYGISLWKGHRESPRKVDLAVCMVGALMLRRMVLNNPNRRRKRSGNVW